MKLAAPAGYALATSGRLNPASGRYENDGVTTQFGLYLAQGLISEALPKAAAELADAVAALDWSGTGEAALAIFKNPETAKITTAGTFFKLGLLLFDGGFYRESGEALQKCALLDTEKFNLFTVNAWLGHLQDLLGEREKALDFYREALKNDTGRTMRHDQWGLKVDRAWVEERLKTPFTWKR